jgi:2-methylcitrate dehydratase PrpD
MPEQSGATRAVIDFITGARWPEFPQDAIDIGKRCIIDGLGVMLAGSVTDASRIACDYTPGPPAPSRRPRSAATHFARA